MKDYGKELKVSSLATGSRGIAGSRQLHWEGWKGSQERGRGGQRKEGWVNCGVSLAMRVAEGVEVGRAL